MDVSLSEQRLEDSTTGVISYMPGRTKPREARGVSGEQSFLEQKDFEIFNRKRGVTFSFRNVFSNTTCTKISSNVLYYIIGCKTL